MKLLEKLSGALASDTGQLAIAGALGGVVRWVTLRENWRDGLASLLVGAICSLYLGPLVAPLLEPSVGKFAPEQGATGLTAFLVGIGGISLSAFLVELFRKRADRNSRRRDDDEDRDNE